MGPPCVEIKPFY